MRGGEAKEGISFLSLTGPAVKCRQPPRLLHLHRYVDRVTEFLQQKLKQSQLLALKKELMVEKQQEALQEQAALEPKLDLLLEKTRELQKLVSRAGSLPRGRTPPLPQTEKPAGLSAPCPLRSLSLRLKPTSPRDTVAVL
jgi:hypothetical protein